MESLTTYLRYLYGWLVAAQSEAPPPSHIIEAARHEMASMHRAAALGDATAALGHMKALAGVLRVAWADAEPELHHAR